MNKEILKKNLIIENHQGKGPNYSINEFRGQTPDIESLELNPNGQQSRQRNRLSQ